MFVFVHRIHIPFSTITIAALSIEWYICMQFYPGFSESRFSLCFDSKVKQSSPGIENFSSLFFSLSSILDPRSSYIHFSLLCCCYFLCTLPLSHSIPYMRLIHAYIYTIIKRIAYKIYAYTHSEYRGGNLYGNKYGSDAIKTKKKIAFATSTIQK